MKITMTGASGFIGGRLLEVLLQDGHSISVLSRSTAANVPAGVKVWEWNDSTNSLPPEESLRGANAVMHLAGEPVAQRWTAESKRRIRESREAGTRNLVATLSNLARRPEALICASAIGYYGSRGDETLTESSAPGTGFLAEVCVPWEKEAQAAESLGMRVVRMRTGVVLDPKGGALQRMLPIFRVGLGGRLGDGKQWMAWIHREDLVGLYHHALKNSMNGAVNGVAPHPVTNAEFTRVLAVTLRRPALFPAPKLALRLLLGEMADMLFDSQRVIPQAAQTAGYQYQFPHLDQTLTALLRH